MIFNVPSLLKAGAWIELTDAAKGAANWRGFRDPKGVDAIAWHHSVTDPTGNWQSEVQRIWDIHRNNGWGGIGYNIVITTDESNGYAKAVLIGDLASIRAHTPNTKGAFGFLPGYGNVYLIGICFVGHLHINNPTDAQLRTAHEIAKELYFNEPDRFPKLDGWWDNHPHKAFDATQCSGRWDEYQKNGIINPPAIPAPKPPTTTTTTTKAPAPPTTTTTTTSTTTTTTTTTLPPEPTPPQDTLYDWVIKLLNNLLDWLKQWKRG